MGQRVHILGASGAGTTTLGAALAHRFACAHVDTDDIYWAPSEVPFSLKRPASERLALLRQCLADQERWVLSGSLCGWGDALIETFTHVIFLYTPWDLRQERLIRRERQRHGAARLAPGGDMHRVHRDFLSWASRYDQAGLEQRSLATHERWLGLLPGRIETLRLDGSAPAEALVSGVIGAFGW